jgi:hypothetical protein
MLVTSMPVACIFDSERDLGEVSSLSCFLGGWACQRNLLSFSMTDRIDYKHGWIASGLKDCSL